MPKNAYVLKKKKKKKSCKIAGALRAPPSKPHWFPAAGCFALALSRPLLALIVIFYSTLKINTSNKQQIFCFCFFRALAPIFTSNSAIFVVERRGQK